MSSILLCTIIQQRSIAFTPPFVKMMVNNYPDAIVALNNLISNAEIIKKNSTHDQSRNMVDMAAYLKRLDIGHRQLDKLKVIHVSGTKGKGSTCSYTESILRSHGYKTGFYSSPHLLEVRERIRINGLPLTRDMFSYYFWNVYNALDGTKKHEHDMPFYFSFLTLMAFEVFLKEKVDVAVIEVGIGGEYDSTNIVKHPFVVGITPLDLDHTSMLGHTLDSIAWNKAGIMKSNAKAFTVQQPDEAMKILQQRSVEKDCSLTVINGFCSNSINSNWPRNIQTENAGLAWSLAKEFIDIDHVNGNDGPNTKCFDPKLAKKAIKEHKWPGRYEIFRRKNCLFYLDGAHTESSLKICCDWFLSKSVDNTRSRVLIFNLTGQRDSEKFLNMLKTVDFELAIFMPNVGDHSAELLDTIQLADLQLEQCMVHKEIWHSINPQSEAMVFLSFLNALNHLENVETKEYDVLITGSIMLVGAAMSILDPTLSGLLD